MELERFTMFAPKCTHIVTTLIQLVLKLTQVYGNQLWGTSERNKNYKFGNYSTRQLILKWLISADTNMQYTIKDVIHNYATSYEICVISYLVNNSKAVWDFQKTSRFVIDCLENLEKT